MENMDEDNNFGIVEEKKCDISQTDISTRKTTPPFAYIEGGEGGGIKRLKFYKKGKIANVLKRRKLNEKMVKILTPKSACLLLNEMKYGCSYVVKETPSQGNISFTVQVKHETDILGIGQGVSKSQAKSLAAENAIKTLFSRAVKSVSEEVKTPSEGEPDLSVFPWASLAQFALYKMLNEWQLQNPELLQDNIQKFMDFAKGSKVNPNPTQTKKEVPSNANELHPTTLLYTLHPALKCLEVERRLGPPSFVKVAFELDGKQYCGTATNKKEAKKEAAKLLLGTLYGVKYEDVKKNESQL